jgi:hypothetical protein
MSLAAIAQSLNVSLQTVKRRVGSADKHRNRITYKELMRAMEHAAAKTA